MNVTLEKLIVYVGFELLSYAKNYFIDPRDRRDGDITWKNKTFVNV